MHWCSQEVWRKSPPLPSSNLLIAQKLRTSGVWGEAPSAKDFGAFLNENEAFGANKICHE